MWSLKEKEKRHFDLSDKSWCVSNTKSTEFRNDNVHISQLLLMDETIPDSIQGSKIVRAVGSAHNRATFVVWEVSSNVFMKCCFGLYEPEWH